MIYRIASYVAIAAGAAGLLAMYYARWVEAFGLGLLAVICAGIAWWEPRR
jgi:hypothetical protein